MAVLQYYRRQHESETNHAWKQPRKTFGGIGKPSHNEDDTKLSPKGTRRDLNWNIRTEDNNS